MNEDARERWNARYASDDGPSGPARFLTDRVALLPTAGRALDVAGGKGRNAIWLAERGLEVVLVDVSDVAVAHVNELAATARLPLTAVAVALTSELVPPGPFDLILAHHYLDRAVWMALPSRLAPGGVLLLCQPTVHNLERHARPPAEWLLEAGEVATLAASMTANPGFAALEATEAWTRDDRHEGHLVVRKAGDPADTAP